MANTFFAVVFPTSCSLCQQEIIEASLIDICRNCWAHLKPWAGAACAHCGLPFPSPRALDSSVALCPQCRDEEFHFDLARSYGLYGGGLRAAILQLKFRRRERLGKRLGELLSLKWDSLGASGANASRVLMPVPLHRTRRRERGFNQAELLARGLSRRLARSGAAPGLRVETRCLYRTRATPPQTGLSLHQRKENVRDVFAVVRPEHIRDRVVILVDDVMTTGATLSSAAGVLKHAGALQVLGLTLARATPQFPDPDATEPGQTLDDFEREWT
ncbi:MAG: double zinc ribbon domain-containing protein [Terriglobia bacterium]